MQGMPTIAEEVHLYNWRGSAIVTNAGLPNVVTIQEKSAFAQNLLEALKYDVYEFSAEVVLTRTTIAKE